ncbi:folate-binding protein YgfZ [uncultured Agrobacterium sp.]|uniref:CAF17-like 4Fe-4S cluster assembly/insertion protein YgfZ n=1 Tax=uncultured Agrobacterium sp. TaxID=157277 RepID=UPI0025827917|nr:folate-binding protein YgfZ [uncultured Agrobacterium sp.]
MTSAFLSDHTFIRVSGTGATEFLQNLITTDVEALAQNEARPGALLTPQGKILFDFLISRTDEGYLLETSADQQDALLRRLTMYKLRAPVDLRAEDVKGVSLYWDEDALVGSARDVRFAKAGLSLHRLPGNSAEGDASAYDALRVAHGIAASGIDYALQDAFPHDVLMDVNDGVSFKKGCFVGQEVVSRMKHRGTARRRVALISAESALPASGTDIVAGGKPMGTLGTVSGNRGLAIIRIDRAADAMASGSEITVGDVPVSVALPEWTGLSFPSADPAASAED